MKRLYILLIACIQYSSVYAITVTPIPRSQTINVARDMVGWQIFIHRPCATGFYSALAITPEYGQSFRPQELAQTLFGDAVIQQQDAAFINVTGSTVIGRSEFDWVADYFGLPPNYQSRIYFAPSIHTALVDVSYYQGLDPIMCGLYFRLHAPIVHTHWNLCATEAVISHASTGYRAGYFSSTEVPRNRLVDTALDFLSGTAAPDLSDPVGTTQCNQSIQFQKLAWSKFTSTHCNSAGISKTGLADIEWIIGWNFIRNEDYLLGMSVLGVIPAGNTPSEFYFSPMISDGHHWKLGLGFNGQAIFWRNECEDSSIGAYLEARAYHAFQSCQIRCFDLCARPNSRYMLAQKMGTHRLPIHITGEADAGVEFQNEYAPIANITRSKVSVEIGVEGDVALKVAYMTPRWSVDLGYDYWGRSCERICRRIPFEPLNIENKQAWALKGDAQVVGFTDANECVRLAAVQEDATIHVGTNNFASPNINEGGINGVRPTANPGITNAIELTAGNAGTTISDEPVAGRITTRSSNPVVFITEDDINKSGTKALSHKVFFHISYACAGCTCFKPFIGIGGEIEFRHESDPSLCSTALNCALTCNNTHSHANCRRSTFDQWGVWVKGGVLFN